MLRVTPLYGSTGHERNSKSISLPPTCTLIEYGGIKILVNVGLDESTYGTSLHEDFFHYKFSNIQNLRRGHRGDDEVEEKEANRLRSALESIDAVLLTDSSLQSLGALPLLYGRDSSTSTSASSTGSGSGSGNVNSQGRHIPLMQPPIYATYPTVKMGQMNLYDHHANISLDGGNPGYSLSDVDALFSPVVYQRGMEALRPLRAEDHHLDDKEMVGLGGGNHDVVDSSQSHSWEQKEQHQQKQRPIMPIQTVKYAQSIIVPDPVTGKPAISITAHRAGYLLGASYFILKRLADETEVVVAPVYHHAKEKHLDNSTLYQYATASDVIVTTYGGPGYPLGKLYNSSNPKMKPILSPPSVTRDEGELIETVLSTLRRGGNVLLPTDTSGRVLELLYILNQHWERHRLEAAYNLCWVGSMVHNTLDFVRSQLEWMAAPLGAQFDSGRGHPFALKSVQMFTSVAELEANCLSGDDNDRGENRGGNNPTCVLASGATLDHGPARDMFLKWSENADNTIILTDFRRCVQRGVVVQRRKRGKNRMATNIHTNAIANPQMLMPSTSSEWEGNAVVTDQGVSVISSGNEGAQRNIGMEPVRGGEEGVSDMPNVIQEEEESAGAINIGTTLAMDQVSEYCTSAQLLLKWCEAKAAGEEMADVVECDVPVPKRAPLAGAELKAFLKQEEAKRLKEQAAEERRAMLREVELAKGRLRLNEEDPGATSSVKPLESNTAAGSTNDAKQRDSSARPKKKSRFDAQLFLKFSKPCHLTFEVREEAVGIGQPDSVAKYGIGESIGREGEVLEDDYGIAVEAERFVDIVTGVDSSKFAKGSGRIGDDVRRRGLGLDGTLDTASGLSNVQGKLISEGLVLDSMDEELALEAQDLSEGTGIIRGRNNRPPVKVSTEVRLLEVLAEIAYVPLEAIVDDRASRQSIRALQPRQVVMLGAGRNAYDDEENQVSDDELSTPLLSYGVGERSSTFAPTDCETVELSVGHAAYPVRLIDTPYMSMEEKARFLEAGEELPNHEPHEVKVGGCAVSLLDYVATGQKVAADGSIVLAPRNASHGGKRPIVMLSDGDVLLTDLRSEIIAQGMKAEYSAHAGYSQLIINGRIVVRKDQESGKINVEGPLCEDFFRVRHVICGQFVQI
eukprot:CAMPEP_0176498852 /NCGR_PEP_ID=MMETSP0200_2-20121128/12579_1 /TAXON_ID=947934 /ORGANISM="Chaetoceros sp., Strain GSL56" /LENGTH=1134 /DNA_ID=CAMNT_0017897161 /DNA_START=225 /DNA_END=3629 /DNA_ORIENTATION=-